MKTKTIINIFLFYTLCVLSLSADKVEAYYGGNWHEIDAVKIDSYWEQLRPGMPTEGWIVDLYARDINTGNMDFTTIDNYSYI